MNWRFWRKKPAQQPLRTPVKLVIVPPDMGEVTVSIQLALQGMERRTMAKLEALEQRVRSVKEQALAMPDRRK